MSDENICRVVHIVETMELGGMERMISTLARATDRKKFEVQVVCLRAIGPVGEALRAQGIVVTHAGLPPRGFELSAFRKVSNHLQGHGFDVAHTHNTPGLLFGAVGARLAGIPSVVHTEHGRQFPDRLHYMVAERVVSTFVRYVIGVSESTTNALHAFEKIPRRKLRTIANGVAAPALLSPADRKEFRSSFDIPDSAFVVGTVGRLVWEKGLPHLLNSWQRVCREQPASVLLVVGDGPLRAELESLATKLDINAHVRFAGARSDVAACLGALDAFAMPSVSEGLPLALLEAMAAGLPIVATSVGGMPTALDNSTCGIVVPPGNSDALAEAIIQLMRDPALAQRIGKAAAARFLSNYTESAMARAYEQLYLDGSVKRKAERAR